MKRGAPVPECNPAEAGFTIIELMAALSVLAIGFVALAAALGLGFKQIALGRQRQTATEIANGRIEHLRNVPYASIALSSAPTHSTDVSNPDYYVSGNGTQYDYTGAGTNEALIESSSSGQVLHLEDPVTVGATIMSVYQFVTWADQPNSVKRLTVVVAYRPVAIEGAARFVRVSTYFTPGTVKVTSATPGATQGSSSPTPSPSPSPTGPCTGDTAAPTGSFAIVSGTGSDVGYTASSSVSITMSLTDSCTPITEEFSNDNTTFGSWVTYEAAGPTVSWTLTSGDGSKSVWARVSDGISNQQTLGPKTIVVDGTKPATPATLTRTASCSGSTRSVHLSWSSSTDTNFKGYRVYESINSAAWTAIGTSSSTTFDTSHSKTLDSVRFYVVGYDKAGNESNASPTISLTKNQCS